MTGVEGLQNAGFEPVKVQLWLANRICGSLCCSVPSRPGSSRAAIGCRTAVGEIVARTAIEPHLRAVLAGNDAKAVVFDFVQPLAARGQLIGFGWEARRDEAGREGRLQHVD